MEATRPLLGGGDGDDAGANGGAVQNHYYQLHNGNGHTATTIYGHNDPSHSSRRRGSLLILDDATARDDNCCSSCSRLICCLSSGSFGSGGHAYTRVASPTSGYKDAPMHREDLLSDSTASSTGSSGTHSRSARAMPSSNGSDPFACTTWGCWKWMFPDRVRDYDDFASSEEMGEVYYIRQKMREFFDASHAEDADMVRHLWSAIFPTLPYDGRVNPRWREIGFQNDDPASDFRASGRFGLKMLLYFADHMNEEFKRLVRENRFPVCLCALNVIEMLLIHLNLKDPIPLVCPCCGTENAELESSNPSRDRPELKGFLAILTACSWSASRSSQLIYTSEWPIEVAFAQVFMHTMIVLDSVWKQQLQRDPTLTLLHFRDALAETCKKVVSFLARRNSPVDLVELAAWSTRHTKAKTSVQSKKPAKKCM